MIAPALCHVEYLMHEDELPGSPEREHTAYIPLKQFPLHNEQPHFSLDADLSGQRLTISITPVEALTVTSCRILLSGDFASYTKVLFNGYQSWTDTREVPLNAAQRGLAYMPKNVIKQFVLDGSGDYRFHQYVNRPGVLHGWSYAYFIGDPGIWLAASLRENHGFTLMEWNSDEGFNISPETPNRELTAGESALLADVALITIDAGEDQDLVDDDLVQAAFDTWFDMLRSAQSEPGISLPRRHEILTGYTSWYRHYQDIDEQKIIADLDAAERTFARLDTTGFRTVFQIDDGYALIGDWTYLHEEKFPQGMRYLSDAIRAHGFTPGLWMAPFVCEKNSRLYREHADWLLKDNSGAAVRAGGHWSGSYALDILHPEVRDYVTMCLRTAVEDWGYDLLKLDFLYAACMIPHGGMNRGELMAAGMRLIREAVGPDVIIDGCGVPLVSTFGLVDYCRIGCDVGLDWDDVPHMHLTERERVSTRNSVFNTVYRSPLDGRAWGNDPDVLLLRKDVKYTNEQRAMVANAAACYASMLLTSDDFNTWTMEDLDTFQEMLNIMKLSHERRTPMV